jgi:hypothetical protein
VTVPVASPARSVAALGGFGVLVEADGGPLQVEVSADYVDGSGQRMQGVGVAFHLPLADGNQVPYVGFGVAWVSQHLGGRGASGAQARPAVGLLWGHHRTVQARLEAAYFVDLFQEQDVDRLFPGSDAAHLCHGLSLSMGAAF